MPEYFSYRGAGGCVAQRSLVHPALFFFCCACLLLQPAEAQSYNCSLKPPVVTIDFGSGEDAGGLAMASLPNYRRVDYTCPFDGSFVYTPHTSGCFGGDWFTLTEDHTPGDGDGNMMLVNATYAGGLFFKTTISGLTGGARYQFSSWLINVCRLQNGCAPLPPNISILLKTRSGQTVGAYETGQIAPRNSPLWKQYLGFFTMPPTETTLVLTMEDQTPGGCGNDFALDDITIRECVPIQPPVTAVQKTPPPVVKKQVPVTKPVAKKAAPSAPVAKQTRIHTVETKEPEIPVGSKAAAPQLPSFPPLPAAVKARANPVVKQIETEAGELKLDLYDNGEIDGDTVSIYHNNELIVSKARLSQKPITFHITLDKAAPHHELIMVANNLGTIPPNTSLMIVTAGSKRYQIFISSTEQKNAKVVIDLNE